MPGDEVVMDPGEIDAESEGDSSLRLFMYREALAASRSEAARLTEVLLSRHGGEPLALLAELDEARRERDEARAEAASARDAAERVDAEAADFEDRIVAFEEAVRGHRVLDVPETRAAVLAVFRSLRNEAKLLTHKVITCGVAASHPDPALSRRGAYGGKWDSPQAEEVRALRAEAGRLREALRAVEVNEGGCGTKCVEIPTTCAERFPGQRECWCGWCVARSALGPEFRGPGSTVEG